MNESWPDIIYLNGPDGQAKPLYFLDEVGSSLDEAWKLIAEDRLPVWGSLLAKSQNKGRGRMGRTWQSPPGHLYAALRLPLEKEPFNGPGASLATAVLLASALNDFDFSINIKWPNDLISAQGKVGGILLEAKKNALVAGIGLNLTLPPEGEWQRDPRSIPAAALSFTVDPKIFWNQLAEKIFLYYNTIFFGHEKINLPQSAEKFLLWKGQEILLENPSTEPICPLPQITGKIIGLAPDGALIVEKDRTRYKIWSGSLYKMKKRL